MKTFNTVMKILLALAAVAGAVYAVATYGDTLVAWAKKLIHRSSVERYDCDPTCEESEIAPEADSAAQEATTEEAPAEETAADENAVVADDADFEG